MKFVKALLCALLVGLAGCGSGTVSSTKQQQPYTNTDGYPLDTCVVTGEKLGSMGAPHVVKYEGKTVKFCCAACLKDFNKEPATYMAIIEKAEKKAAPAN